MNPTASVSASPSRATPLKFAVHGRAVEVECGVPELLAPVRRLLGPFAVAGWPDGFAPVLGTVRPYEHAEVMRHLSPTARPLPIGQDLLEVFEEGERFWLVDDRWGMAEINFLKGQWRAWLLPRPQLDPLRQVEMAVLWPLAQLLRPRGVYLLPAVSFVRNGWAALVLCPFGLGPELTALARAGYKVIGQRWTAVREEDGRLALLHMPGWVERETSALSRAFTAGAAADAGQADLNDEYLGGWQNHAFCDAVFVAGPGRRPHASLTELRDAAAAGVVLRQAWPIAELHPSRRHSTLPTRLAQLCRCAELQLSRNPSELLTLLDAAREGSGRVAAPARADREWARPHGHAARVAAAWPRVSA